jgi:hypothetical protein
MRFADLPQIEGATGRFLLQQMASVAELEAGMISARTRAALGAAKARGKKLGGQRIRTSDGRPVVIAPEARRRGASANRMRAVNRAADLAPTIFQIQQRGASTLAAIAAGLNDAGIPTPRGQASGAPCRSSARSMRCRRLEGRGCHNGPNVGRGGAQPIQLRRASGAHSSHSPNFSPSKPRVFASSGLRDMTSTRPYLAASHSSMALSSGSAMVICLMLASTRKRTL